MIDEHKRVTQRRNPFNVNFAFDNPYPSDNEYTATALKVTQNLIWVGSDGRRHCDILHLMGLQRKPSRVSQIKEFKKKQIFKKEATTGGKTLGVATSSNMNNFDLYLRTHSLNTIPGIKGIIYLADEYSNGTHYVAYISKKTETLCFESSAVLPQKDFNFRL